MKDRVIPGCIDLFSLRSHSTLDNNVIASINTNTFAALTSLVYLCVCLHSYSMIVNKAPQQGSLTQPDHTYPSWIIRRANQAAHPVWYSMLPHHTLNVMTMHHNIVCDDE